jgi:excisionase family DNA binding protein
VAEQERKWLTIPEAAARLGVNTRSAYDLVRDGKLPVLRIGLKRPQYRVPIAAMERLEAAMGDEAFRRIVGEAG